MSFLTNDDVTKYLIGIGFLDAAGGRKMSPPKAKTADYTIATGTDPSGTLFTNRGAGATVNFTLPAPAAALAGVFYDFLGIADFAILVKTATADTLIALNDITADSVAMSTATQLIAGYMRVICDGTSWIAVGLSVGTTFTVAT